MTGLGTAASEEAGMTMEDRHTSEEDTPVVRIGFSPRQVVRPCLFAVVFLLALHGIWLIARFGFGHDTLIGMHALLRINVEMNLTTWFSSMILAMAALLFFVVFRLSSADEDRWRYHWLGLVFIFLFLSIDETADIHPKIGKVFSYLVVDFGIPSAWVIPYSILTLVAAYTYITFFFNLPVPFRYQALASAILFVGGSLGGEVTQILLTRADHLNEALYELSSVSEEVMEMTGIILLLYALLRLLGSKISRVELNLKVMDGAPRRSDVPADLNTHPSVAHPSNSEAI
jgi:hypothetical protein